MPYINLIYLIIQFIILFKLTHCKTEEKKYSEIKLSVDEALKIYQRWTDQAYSGLIGAMANQRIYNKPDELEKFRRCTKHATTVPQHALCLEKLLNRQDRQKLELKKQNTMKEFNYAANNIYIINKEFNSKKETSKRLTKYKFNPLKSKLKSQKESEWIGGFRVVQKKQNLKDYFFKKRINQFRRIRRSTIDKDIYTVNKVNAQKYSLLSPNPTSIGSVAKMLTKLLINAKGKNEITLWQQTIEKLRKAKSKQKSMNEMDKSENSMEDIYDNPIAFKGIDFNKKNENLIYNQGIKPEDKLKKKLMQLVRDGVKLSYGLTGKNMSEVDEKNIRFASPRFLSVVPEDTKNENIINISKKRSYKNDTIDLISPSLFSLHDQGVGLEKRMSIPNLIKDVKSNDQNHWLNLIMEFSGVNDQAVNLEKQSFTTSNLAIDAEVFKKKMRSPDGQPLYFTKENATQILGKIEERKMETYEKLLKKLSMKQWKQINTTGFVLMTPTQIQHFYGPHSPYNSSDAIDRLSNKTRKEIFSGIRNDIRDTANSKSFNLRMHDIIGSPALYAPIIDAPSVGVSRILSPLAFSPFIKSPSVLGPMILSPWIFSPLIISPHVLTPLILSPHMFSPHILSPLVMQPNILSPGVFSPMIISPFVLSPGIISPFVFSPFILNPTVLSPIILVPTVGSPLVLSPFALSPVILSPQSLGGLFLSPYALSPVILSPLSFFIAVLSPSWLS